MSKESKEYLKHIQDECLFIISNCDNLNYNEFIHDETLKRAVVRSLEIIGEASKKIPADTKVKWKEIQWRNMAGMRDRLIHDYLGVNYAIVWDVMKNKIPQMSKQISIYLSED
jgi:uncharacterized protein with HEPN domain